MTFEELLDIQLFHYGHANVKVHHLFSLVLVFVITRFVLFLIKKFIKKTVDDGTDRGRAMSIYLLVKYFIVVIAIVLALDLIGVKITILLAGSAALLVGFGLGIQSLFNDSEPPAGLLTFSDHHPRSRSSENNIPSRSFENSIRHDARKASVLLDYHLYGLICLVQVVSEADRCARASRLSQPIRFGVKTHYWLMIFP